MPSNTSVRWLYKLEKNVTWSSGCCVDEEMVFKDKKGEVRLIIETDGEITVTRGYAWNGCSPKVYVWDLFFGTPEGVVHVRTEKVKTYYASLIHDALYQFLGDGLPLSRRDADNIFFRLMAESDFKPRWIYWLFVRVFGWLVWGATKAKRKTKGKRQNVSELVSEPPGLLTDPGERVKLDPVR